jgi:uncharacterized membrane protein YjgN (DUF898 family)/tetratricopeptide (TPR) repeat protein
MAPLLSIRVLALTLSLAAGSAAGGPSEKVDAFRRKAQLRLAEEALALHDIDDAQTRLENALSLARKDRQAPELAPILERLGDVYFRRNQLGAARSFYERALQVEDAEAKRRTFEKIGRVATRRGRHEDAADSYEEALSLGGAGADLYLRLGEARLRARQTDEAREAFEKAIAGVPSDGLEQALIEESVARRYLWLAGDRKSAALHAEKAFEIRRRHKTDAPPQFLRTLRNRSARAADSQEAESYLQQLPTFLARQIRSRRLAAKGDLKQAVAQQRSAIAEMRASGRHTGIELAEALEALAALEERGEQDGRAIARWDEALDLRRELKAAGRPSSIRTLEKLVSELERAGEAAGALSVLTGYVAELRADPDTNPLAVAAAEERLGDFFERQGGYDHAAERYAQAISLRQSAWGRNDGGLEGVLEKHADALRRSGREDEARKSESRIAELTFGLPATRPPPRGPRDTGTWLSEPSGLAFIGLALSCATLGLVWLGWSTFTHIQPAFEARFRPAPPHLADAPGWRPVYRPAPRYGIAFNGRGGALFGIWSVNMAFTLLTLGLYFFWGKIRVRRYFWGQAELAGDRFAFHGTGRELLFGWLKAAPALALVLWGPGLLDLAWENPNAGLYGAGVAFGLLGLLWPLAEIGASRYRLSRTSWRAVRFSFRGAAWPYMKLWLGGMALWVLTLGLWAPFFDAARRRYMLAHTHFGDARFECDIHGRDLFAFHLVSWVLFLPSAGISYFWYKALAERYYWSRTKLVHNQEESRAEFECSLRGVDLLVLWIQTMATLALSLGLAWPWTRIWEARLRLQTITMTGDFRPGRIRQSATAAGAAGEGAADFLGLDFGFFA